MTHVLADPASLNAAERFAIPCDAYARRRTCIPRWPSDCRYRRARARRAGGQIDSALSPQSVKLSLTSTGEVVDAKSEAFTTQLQSAESLRLLIDVLRASG